MDSLPGGGAEIFNERVRRIICDHKIDGDEWLETARTAHQLGLRSNCTMLYGHIENEEDRVDHLVQLRALQDETHGFVTFIPLAFHPDNTPLQHIPKTTGFDDIKNIAVARLMLDNIPHIKAYWVMMTPRIAQIALRFGADDIDGTIVEERIYHDAGATTSAGSAARRAAAADPQGRPRAGGARHALPAGGARRSDVHRAGVGPEGLLAVQQVENVAVAIREEDQGIAAAGLRLGQERNSLALQLLAGCREVRDGQRHVADAGVAQAGSGARRAG